jgi:Raf kinase inhibitor-like YbhB/YbcL family protein
MTGASTPEFVLTSDTFEDGGDLPTVNSCDGPNGGESPALTWTGAPNGTRGYVLALQDPDAGAPNTITHWIVYNIPATVTEIPANQPMTPTLANGAMQGQNARRTVGYIGSCPPPGTPAHHYTFQVLAVDGPLAVAPGASIVDVAAALNGHVVGATKLVANFGR